MTSNTFLGTIDLSEFRIAVEPRKKLAKRLKDIEERRPLVEMRLRARWKLGQMLAIVERSQGERTDKKTSSAGLTKLLAELELDRQTALEAQRIGTPPEETVENDCNQHHTA